MKFLVALVALLSTACVTGRMTPPPVVTPAPIVVNVQVLGTNDTPLGGAWVDVCGRVATTRLDGRWIEEFKRTQIDCVIKVTASGYLDYEKHIFEATTTVRMVRVPTPTIQRLHVEGKVFRTDAGQIVWPVLASDLSALSKDDVQRDAVLDQFKSLGFDGTRVFAGSLNWAGQTDVSARSKLPGWYAAHQARGMYAFTTAITDSLTGYDVEAHLRDVATLASGYDGALLEVANEYYHPTQSQFVNDAAALCAMAKRVLASTRVPWALGAAPSDEPDEQNIYAGECGPFSTSHLDRSRDLYNQVRRVREIKAIIDATGKAAMNSEPLGAAEFDQPGRRTNQPWWFFTLSVLNRAFGVVGVFHSEDGLNARLLGPTQVECAKAFVAGARVLPTNEMLAYRNTGQGGSPIKGARFTDSVVRAYSFLEPGEQSGFVIVIHLTDTLGDGQIDIADHWAITNALPSAQHVTILRVQRSEAVQPVSIDYPKAA